MNKPDRIILACAEAYGLTFRDVMSGTRKEPIVYARQLAMSFMRRGRAALFEDCGLGKSLQQLEWARQVCLHTGQPVLILCPPSVREQTREEGRRFGIMCNVADSDADILTALCPDLKPFKGIHITNYEKLHKFDVSKFAAIENAQQTGLFTEDHFTPETLKSYAA